MHVNHFDDVDYDDGDDEDPARPPKSSSSFPLPRRAGLRASTHSADINYRLLAKQCFDRECELQALSCSRILILYFSLLPSLALLLRLLT